MIYAGVKVKAEEYFQDTEEYIERFWGNAISSYDLEHRFPRKNNTNSDGNTAVDEDFQPEPYEIPKESSFTSHDVAMLGYLGCGVIAMDHVSSYGTYKNLKESIMKSGGNEAVGERVERTIQITTRGMMVDSFFTTEPRVIHGYSKAMTQIHHYVREAVCSNDLTRIADLCRKGLDILRASYNINDTERLVNRYADGYVCGQILELLDRNPQLSELVALKPEERNYYRGIARVSKVIREGTIAKEKLALAEEGELTPEQTEEYGRAVDRYMSLSIMMSTEIKNRQESSEQAHRVEQILGLMNEPDVKAELEKRNIGIGAMGCMANVANCAIEQDSNLVRRLGEADAAGEEVFFKEIYDSSMGDWKFNKIPGCDNLSSADVSNCVNRIFDAEANLHSSQIVDENLQKAAEEEKAERKKAVEEEKLTDIDRLLEEHFAEAEENSFRYISRGDLITVDGRTIREIMADEFVARERDANKFEQYYQKNVREVTRQLVKNALQEGKYTEIYAVGTDGVLSGEPQQISFPWGKPAVLRPEDAKKIQDSREFVTMVNCYGLHQINNGMQSGARKKEFLGDWMRENDIHSAEDIKKVVGGNKRGLSVGREALVSLTVMALFQKGYSIDEIGRPGMLKEIKQETAREVISHIREDDYTWLGEVVMEGQNLLLNQLDEKMKDIDISDDRQLMSPENRHLFFIAHCAHDAGQEKDHFREEMLAAAGKKDPEKPMQLVQDLENRISSSTMLLGGLDEAMRLKINLNYGLVGYDSFSLVNPITSTEYLRRKYVEKQKEQPDIPLSRCLVSDDFPKIAEYEASLPKDSESFQAFVEALGYPPTAKIMGKEFLLHNFHKNLDMVWETNSKGESKSVFRVTGISQELRDTLEISRAQGRAIDNFEVEVGKCRKQYPGKLSEFIDELESADRFWQNSSAEYQHMQKCVQEMEDALQPEVFGNPPTYQQLKNMQKTAENLRQSVRDYLKHKQEHHTDTRWERRRVDAAEKLLKLSQQIKKSGDLLEDAFVRLPDLRPERDEYLKRQQVQAEKNEETYEDIMRSENSDYDKDKIKEQEKKTAGEIEGHMSRRFGGNARGVYRAKGADMTIKKKVMDSDGSIKEKSVTVDAMEYLRSSIQRNRDLVIRYIIYPPRKDRMGKLEFAKKEAPVLQSMMAGMIAVESIARDRIIGGFQPGQEKIEPGPRELAFAKDPSGYLKAIQQTDAFKEAWKDMSPEKMKNFILEDGAMEAVRSMEEEAVKEKGNMDKAAGNVKENDNIKETDTKQEEKSKGQLSVNAKA